jgi:hypothetical protein
MYKKNLLLSCPLIAAFFFLAPLTSACEPDANCIAEKSPGGQHLAWVETNPPSEIFSNTPQSVLEETGTTSEVLTEVRHAASSEAEPSLSCEDTCADVEPQEIADLLESTCDPSHDCPDLSNSPSFLLASGCGCTTHDCH